MLAAGVPPKLVRLIKSNYDGAKARVRAYSEKSCPFELKSGKWPLSPVLFNFVINRIMQRSTGDYQGV